jgi:hypothetical protein
MTDSQIFAWILMCVSANGSTLQDVVSLADAIMKTPISHAELQKGLGWLIHCRLVEIQDNRYILTSGGRDLRERASWRAKTTMERWEATTAELSRFSVVGAPLHVIDPQELHKAYRAYEKTSRILGRRLREQLIPRGAHDIDPTGTRHNQDFG